jgi:hypothetical protein
MRSLHLFTAVFGWQVRRGPFAGMRYVRESVCSTLAPKLLGTYECELNDWLEALIARKFFRVLNIGAAEGYYAVGFALRSPGTRVIAFEADAGGRTLISEMAALNKVNNRVAVAGHCSCEILDRHLAGQDAPLLIVDIEGGEIELLDPERLPALRRCPMLIELHERREPAADILRARFAHSHTFDERWTRPRNISDLPVALRLIAGVFGDARMVSTMAEQRPGRMRWFLCQPRKAAA